MAENENKEVELPLEWYFPDSLVPQYANNLIVQHSDTEYVISFFMTKPPLIIGASSKELLDQIKSVRSTCVAQIIVAKDKMPAFVEAMRTNIERFESKTQQDLNEDSTGVSSPDSTKVVG